MERKKKKSISKSFLFLFLLPKNEKLWCHKVLIPQETSMADGQELLVQVKVPAIQGTRGLGILGKRKRMTRGFCFTSCVEDAS